MTPSFGRGIFFWLLLQNAAAEWKPLWTLPKQELPKVDPSTFGTPLALDLTSCMRPPDVSRAGEPCRRTSGMASGILLSFNDTHPRAEVVKPLALHHHRGEFVNQSIIQRYESFGVKNPQVMLAQLWVGAGISFKTLGDGDWPGDNSNFSKWEKFVERVAATSPADMAFDIWNEPNGGYFWTRSMEQYYNTWHVAVHTLRRLRPGARIVGPSISSYDLDFMRNFLVSAKANGTVPEIISWHWYSFNGSEIPEQAAQVRALISELGVQDLIKGISINEIVSAEQNFNPAVHISYFANLERAAVDSAMHACWPESTTGQQCSEDTGGDNCGEWGKLPVPEQYRGHGGVTLDGLLTCDGSQSPRGVWWAYKAYSLLNGTLLAVRPTTELDALAAITDDKGSMAIAIARLAGNSNNSVKVQVTGIPDTLTTGKRTVQFAAARIQDTGVLPLHVPNVSRRTLPLSPEGRVELDLEMALNEVVLVYLGPSAYQKIKTYAEPPASSTALKMELVI